MRRLKLQFRKAIYSPGAIKSPCFAWNLIPLQDCRRQSTVLDSRRKYFPYSSWFQRPAAIQPIQWRHLTNTTTKSLFVVHQVLHQCLKCCGVLCLSCTLWKTLFYFYNPILINKFRKSVDFGLQYTLTEKDEVQECLQCRQGMAEALCCIPIASTF